MYYSAIVEKIEVKTTYSYQKVLNVPVLKYFKLLYEFAVQFSAKFIKITEIYKL